jgi:hypothetical protein
MNVGNATCLKDPGLHFRRSSPALVGRLRQASPADAARWDLLRALQISVIRWLGGLKTLCLCGATIKPPGRTVRITGRF